MSGQNKFSKGFTIIELIVVIAIIAILAAIVMVNVVGYIQKAKIAAFVQEVYEMQKAANLYYADKGYYPDGQNPSAQCYSSPAGTLTDDGFFSNYMPLFPGVVNSGATLTYCNTAYATSDGNAGYMCGPNSIKGFEIFYEDYSDDNFPLPYRDWIGGRNANRYCLNGS
jgi:general secretion pathway protein G